MVKKNVLSKLHQPVHPVLAFVLIVIVAGAVVSVLVSQSNQNSTAIPQQYQTQFIPTATPLPIDTSTWKTYTDWKYGYSIKLPTEFVSYIPTKGYTGDTIDPQGNGFAQFEDRTLSGDYPNRTAKYGFYVRIEPGSPAGSNCTIDQECLRLLRKNVGRATAILLQARFLNRKIEGLATVIYLPNSSSPTGNDLAVYYEYPFIVNGRVFHVEVNFYYPKSFQETQAKAPLINTILSSITFPSQ